MIHSNHYTIKTRLITLITFLVAGIILSFAILSSNKNRKIIEHEKENVVQSKQAVIKEKIRVFHQLMTKSHEQASAIESILKEQKRRLSSLGESTLSVMTYQYEKMKAQGKNEKEIQESLKNILKSVHFEKGTGYFFAFNDEGVSLAHADKNFEGKNQLHVQDQRGTYVIREILNIGKKQGEGFLTYYWNRPGQEGEAMKISYVGRFKPYNWTIGTGMYVDDYLPELKRRLKDLTNAFRYDIGKTKNNYVGIADTNGTVLANPAFPDVVGKNYYDLRDQNGVYVYREIIKRATELGEGFVRYYWPKPGSEHVEQKLTYVKLFKPLDWVIYTGVYEGDLGIHELQQELDEKSNRLMREIILISAIFMFIGLFFAFLIQRSITHPVGKMTDMLKDVAEGEGDLKKRLPDSGRDEIGKASGWFNIFIKKIRNMIREIQSNTHTLATATEQLSVSISQTEKSINSISDESVRAATSLNEISATTTQMANTFQETTKNINDLSQLAAKTQGLVVDGESTVTNAGEAMIQIEQSSREIEEITSVITAIANQSNMLSLNAAIEAAKAGSSGKGFAVVADEVRNLALRSQEATGRVINRIEISTRNVEKGNRIISQTEETFQSILEHIHEMTDQICEISSSINEQNQGIQEISSGTEAVSTAAENNSKTIIDLSSTTEQVVQTINDLGKLADGLNDQLNQFRT